MNKSCRLIACTVLAAFAGSLYAAPILDADSSRLSFQARITQGGIPIGGQTVDLEFRLYDGASQQLGAAITVSNVDVGPGGLIDVMVPFDPDDFDGTVREIGVSINGSPELTPRTQIGAVPYAYRANRVTSEELDDAVSLGQGGRGIPPVDGLLRLYGGATFPTIALNGSGSSLSLNGYSPGVSGADSVLEGTVRLYAHPTGGFVTTGYRSSTRTVLDGENGDIWASSTVNVGPLAEELSDSEPFASLQFGNSFGGRMLAWDIGRDLTTVVGSTAGAAGGGLLQLYRGGTGGLTVELAGDDGNGSGVGAWRDADANTSVRISGQDHRLYTYGADDAEHARLGGSGSGNLQLRGGGAANPMTVNLNASGGGDLDLLDAAGSDFGVRLNGGTSTSPGRIRVYDDGSANTIELSGEDGESGAGLLTVRAGSQDRVALLAQYPRVSLFSNGVIETLRLFGNGAGGGGGASIRNDSGEVTVELDGDETASSSGVIRLRRGDGTFVFGLNADTRTMSGRGATINLANDTGQTTVELHGDENNAGVFRLRRANGAIGMVANAAEEMGSELWLYNENGVPSIQLDTDWTGNGNSRIVTGELQITGGSDLSEQFDVSESSGEVEPGTVVCIDTENPGKLTVCGAAYDRKVAGIISGAGGVRTGMYMAQTGSEADGGHPVALTGRVYCKVDASTEPISPGDLLTTSGRPGFAMKATDHAKAYGATIGKAMTGLAKGRNGLVLVLVNLQ